MSSIKEQPLGVVPSSFTTLSTDLPSRPVLRTPVLLGDLSIRHPGTGATGTDRRAGRVGMRWP
jgi:hypothetical protein